MQKRIVILGGAGFIGTHLCLRLLKEGHEVFCVDQREAGSSSLLRGILSEAKFRYIHHNIINSFGIRCDQIYNLVAPTAVRYNKALPVETLKLCMQGSINTLEAARNERARVVYGSLGDIYSADTLFANDTSAGHDECRRFLIEGKRAAEALHRAYRTEFGVDTRIARIFNTYGIGSDPMDQRVVTKMVTAALQNREIYINGSGDQRRTFCWVEDIVDGLVRLMEAPNEGATPCLNFGSNHEISIHALADKIVSLTGSRSRIVHVEQRNDDPRRRMPDISAARRKLEWTPQTLLTEGLQRTIDYLEKELSEKARAGRTWVEVN